MKTLILVASLCLAAITIACDNDGASPNVGVDQCTNDATRQAIRTANAPREVQDLIPIDEEIDCVLRRAIVPASVLPPGWVRDIRSSPSIYSDRVPEPGPLDPDCALPHPPLNGGIFVAFAPPLVDDEYEFGRIIHEVWTTAQGGAESYMAALRRSCDAALFLGAPSFYLPTPIAVTGLPVDDVFAYTTRDDEFDRAQNTYIIRSGDFISRLSLYSEGEAIDPQPLLDAAVTGLRQIGPVPTPTPPAPEYCPPLEDPQQAEAVPTLETALLILDDVPPKRVAYSHRCGYSADSPQKCEDIDPRAHSAAASITFRSGNYITHWVLEPVDPDVPPPYKQRFDINGGEFECDAHFDDRTIRWRFIEMPVAGMSSDAIGFAQERLPHAYGRNPDAFVAILRAGKYEAQVVYSSPMADYQEGGRADERINAAYARFVEDIVKIADEKLQALAEATQ